VEGNHDGYSGINEIKQLLRETNIRVLENEVELLGGLQVVGLNHMRADTDAPRMHSIQNVTTIKEILDSMKIEPETPSLLLHHSPDGMEYASMKGIDLYLSGHTHAGQLFPVTLMNDLIFKYNRGLSNFNGTRIFVSNGAGTFGPPMRVATSSEVVLVKLIPSE
jgi:predicted MPP superfamily phosphohydrolase